MKSPNPERIKEFRLAAELSQRKAGALVFTSADTWKKWEYGINRMPINVWVLFVFRIRFPTVWARLWPMVVNVFDD